MSNWYHNECNTQTGTQGLVIEEGTGRTVAVVYNPKDTALVASSRDTYFGLTAMRQCMAVILREGLTANNRKYAREMVVQADQALGMAGNVA